MNGPVIWKKALLGAAAVFFVTFLGAPMACIALRGIGGVCGLLSDEGFLSALYRSLTVSGISSAITLLIAFLLAYTVHYTQLPKWFRACIPQITCLPMYLPTVTYGFAILYSFGKQGLLNRFPGGQHFEVYGMRGLMLGYIIYTLPSAYLLLDNSMSYIDQRSCIVAQLMGDPAPARFWNTLFKPLLSTLGTAFIQAFFLCFTDFGIPMAIGGQYEVVSMRLYQYMLGALPDFQKGAAAAWIMLCPSLVSILVLRWLRRFEIPNHPAARVQMSRNPLHDAACAMLSGGILAGLCLIFAVIFIIPFMRSWPYDTHFSLGHITALFTTPRVFRIYCNSLITAGASALFGTALAYLAALLGVRLQMPKWVSLLLDGCAVLSGTVPGMVLGIGMLFMFSDTPLQYTFFILIACNMVHFFNTPYLMAVQSLSKISDRWETAAKLMGDRWVQTLTRILIPNTAPTILNMASYFFINSMVTISAVIFLSGAHTMVITARIKELQHFAKFNEIFSLSLLILATNLLVKLLFRWLGKHTAQRERAPRRDQPALSPQRMPVICVLAVLVILPAIMECSDKENVIIYSNADETVIEIMADVLDTHGFQGAYIIQSFGTSELGGRLLAEQENIEADLITISDYYLTSAQNLGLSFADPGYRQALMPHADGLAMPLVGIEGCIVVNEPALRQAGLPVPQHLHDLADPCYRGQISVPSILGSSTGWLLVQAVLDQYGEEDGRKILSGILANAGPHLEMSGSGPMTKLISGETVVAYGIRHQAEHAMEQGIPITCSLVDASYTMTESLAVIDKGESSKPSVREMALCLQRYARPLIAENYPTALYPDEPNCTQTKVYPAPLTAELLIEHQLFYQGCLLQR